jgi:hypothetical protein
VSLVVLVRSFSKRNLLRTDGLRAVLSLGSSPDDLAETWVGTPLSTAGSQTPHVDGHAPAPIAVQAGPDGDDYRPIAAAVLLGAGAFAIARQHRTSRRLR